MKRGRPPKPRAEPEPKRPVGRPPKGPATLVPVATRVRRDLLEYLGEPVAREAARAGIEAEAKRRGWSTPGQALGESAAG